MKIYVGDLLDTTGMVHGIICHQVNNLGVMGAGVALQVKDRYPQVYEDYLKYIALAGKYDVLGTTQLSKIGPGIYIANVFGQVGIDRGVRNTNYGAVADAFSDLKRQVDRYKLSYEISVPYLMGCGLAGGDWDTYSEIVSYYFPTAAAIKYDPNY